MKFGVRLPGTGPLAGPDTIAAFARKAEEVGFDSLWMSNHVLSPVSVTSQYPYSESGQFVRSPDAPYLDTILCLAWASAVTTRIEVGTSALVTGWHHPVNLAKAVASLDVLNGGRTVLVTAAGWMKEEFDMLGVPFAKRGARSTEYVRLLRHLWTADTIDFHGQFFDFAGFKLNPKPVRRPALPIWIGGNSDAALHRVASVGDGWHPISITAADMATKVDVLKSYLDDQGRSLDAVELSVRPVAHMPIALDTVSRFAEVGVKTIVWDPPSEKGQTLATLLAQLEDIAETIIEPAQRL